MQKINGLRFIIGSGCNYDCFFCHHEGYRKVSFDTIEKEKLDQLCEFAKINGIRDISITGGEPFLYWNKLKYLLSIFSSDYFKITLNSNFSLADLYLEEMKEFINIEFHINFSSLDEDKHIKIIQRSYLERVKNNLLKYRHNNFDICLNIPVLHGINSDEVIDLFDYSVVMGFKPRFLVLYPMSQEQDKYVEDVDDIINHFSNAKVLSRYSYGRFDIQSDEGRFEIVRCLCAQMECDICKKNTYIHITPELNLKYCMNSDEQVIMDYSNMETVTKGFMKVLSKLR